MNVVYHERWRAGYDRWKTNVHDPKVVGKCEQCKGALYEGQDVLFDDEIGIYFHDKSCAEKYIETNIDDYTELIIEKTTRQITMSKEYWEGRT